VDPDQTCDNIVYARAQNSEVCKAEMRVDSFSNDVKMQFELLDCLAEQFATNEFRLLIIDSIMALYRTDYVGRGELSERQGVLNAFLRKATQMAEEFNIAVLMVCSS